MADSVSLKEHIEAILEERQKAIDRAHASMEKRLDGMNEFRQTLADQMVTFVRQDVAEARSKGFEAQLAALTTQVIENRGRGVGRNDIWIILVVVVTLAVSVGAILIRH